MGRDANRHADAGFHAGELEVQRRAGVPTRAARLSKTAAPAELGDGVGAFLADRTFAAMTGRDVAGRLWVSPLTGPAGFLRATSLTTLEIADAVPGGDPLHGLAEGQALGVVVVEFATRRRVRINGTLIRAGEGGLVIDVEQAYGNCSQCVQQRVLVPGHGDAPATGEVRRRRVLSGEDVDLIRGADTLFLGTSNPDRGSDASHRGGAAGFVRVEGDRVWWPDYAGNNMFNSFGNLALNAEAALLFLDFTDGRTLQLSGTAVIEWEEPGRPGDDGHTGRRARLTVEELAAGRLLPARRTAHRPYPRNPDLSG